MEQIINFIAEYGVSTLIIASVTILFIGFLKVCKLFSKIKNITVKKLIYYILDIVLSFAGVAIYFKLNNLNFNIDYIIHSCTQISATTTLYALYENLGIRKLWQIFTSWIISLFKTNPEHMFVKSLKKLGLTESTITSLQTVVASELEKINTQK